MEKEEKGKKKAGEKKSERVAFQIFSLIQTLGYKQVGIGADRPARVYLLHLRIVIPFHMSFSLFSPFLHTLRYLSRFLPPASALRISSPSTPIPSFPFLSLGRLSFFRPFRLFFSPPSFPFRPF